MFLTGLYLAIFFAIFNFTSAIMGGIYIAGELGGATEIASYNVTLFGLGNATTLPLAPYLTQRFGALRSLRFSLLLFCLTLILSGFMKTFALFLLFHFLSGVFSGAFFPLGQELLSENLSEKGKETSFAFLAFLTTVTPVLGACFGGWMAYDLSWKAIFFFQIPFVILTFFLLQEKKAEKPAPYQGSFDCIGYALYLLSIGSITLAICLGEQLDWFRSPIINTLFIVTLITTPFFILWERIQENPFLNISLLKIPRVSICLFLLSFLFSAYFGMIILLSLWLHLEANYTPIWISLLLLNMFFAGAILFFFMLKLMKKISPFVPVIVSIICFAISCFYSITFNAEVNFGRLAISRIFAGFGLAFFLFPLFSICLNALLLKQKEQGACLFQSCRLFAGSLGVSIYSTIWYRRKIFYHDRLGSSLTIYSDSTQSFITSFHHKPYDYELLEKALVKQSTALALADTFYLMGFVMVFILLVLGVYLFLTIRKKPLAEQNS